MVIKDCVFSSGKLRCVPSLPRFPKHNKVLIANTFFASLSRRRSLALWPIG
jgi:hypothetical protein